MAPRKAVSISPKAVPVASSTAASKVKPSGGGASFVSSLQGLINNYSSTTPNSLKYLDCFQLFLMLTGIAQFLYCILVTNYPFNAFLGGFSATVGQFVLAASMRSQVNPENKSIFPTITPERAFADFVFASLVLHFFVFSYLG